MSARRLAGTLVVGLTGEIVNKIFPLIVISHAEQALGLEEFGKSQYGIYMVDLLLVFIIFGYTVRGSIDSASHLASNTEKIKKVIGTVVSLRVIHALFTAGVTLVWALSSPQFAPYLPYVIALLFMQFVSAFELSFLNYAKQSLWILSATGIATKAVSLAGVLLLVNDPTDGVTFALLTYGFNCWVPIVTFVMGVSQYGFQVPTVSELRVTFLAALPYGAATVLSGLYDRVDLFIVEWLASARDLGIYSLNYRVFGSLLPVVSTFSFIFFSESLASTDPERKERLLRSGLQGMLAILLPIALGAFFVASPMLGDLISPQLYESGTIFAILCVSLPIQAFILVSVLQVLMPINRLRAVICGYALGFVATSVLCRLGMSYAGLVGVAAGVVLGKLVTAAFLYQRVSQLVRVPLFGDLIKFAPGLLAMLAVCFVMRQMHWGLIVGSGALTYVSVMAYTQRALLRALVNKVFQLQ